MDYSRTLKKGNSLGSWLLRFKSRLLGFIVFCNRITLRELLKNP